jgi:type II secretory pathway pseudopilin PulG
MFIPKPSFRSQVSGLRLKNGFSSPCNLKLETLNLKRRKSRGLSLVELVMFIVIVGVAVAGIISVIGMTTGSSADPMIRKQALSIAEAMLEEVRLQPFTICDADEITGGAAPSGSVTIGTIASASGNGGNNTLNATGVNLSGQNAVLVFVGLNNDDFQTVSSVVIDPGGANVSVPYLADSNNTQSGGDDARIYLFGMVNPPQGTFTVRVTFSSAIGSGQGSNVVVYPLSGVNTSSPFGTPGTDENDGDGHVTVTSASGETVFAGVAGETIGSSTVNSPAVEDADISGGGGDHSLATAHQDGASPNVSFNWNHSNDHWATVGVSVKPGGCVENMGPETGESRYSLTSPFDHVNDYDGFDSNSAVPSGIRNLDGTLIPGLDGYRVTVSVAAQPFGGIGNDANGFPQSLLITVTVTGPGNTTVVLSGYRTRYAPNEVP